MESSLLERFQAGKYKEVVSSWNRVEPVADGNKNERLIIAFALYSLGEIEDCEVICGDLLPYCESRADFLALYGSVLRRNGKIKDSEQIYKKGLSLFPEDSAIGNNYANLLIDQGNLEEAKEILTSIKKLKPDNLADVEANLQRINLLQDNIPDKKELPIGIFTAAFSDELKSINDLPSSVKTEEEIASKERSIVSDNRIEVNEMIKLARLAVNANPERAIDDCNLIHEKLNTPAGELYEVAGDALIRASAFADAEVCYLKAVSLSAGSMACFTNLATLAHMRGDKPLAIEYLAKAISLDNNNIQKDHHATLKTNILAMEKSKGSPFLMQSLKDVVSTLKQI